jgi:hypothetical protein
VDACPRVASAGASAAQRRRPKPLQRTGHSFELFIAAARAVAELVRGAPLAPIVDLDQEVTITAPDPERLLGRWIEELVLRSQRWTARFTEFDIVYLSERQLVASIHGVRVEELRSPNVTRASHDPLLYGASLA